ncbi:hypothetical protein [Bdellovibrio sp. HCB337]|uniref:hypothetical protein n=1 Tax=Bdellovibrio sp. HCB337 TaxID=3394358 RepID=UPI0039A4CA80
MFKSALLLSFILCAGVPAFAQNFRWDLEWYNSVQGTERNEESLIDPTGRRLERPQALFETDLRINTKYTWRKGTRFVFRPRILGDFNQYYYTNPEETLTEPSGKVSVPEAYLEGDPTRSITLAAGLQNYQWGPAEFFSPTNPFFHFRPDSRTYNYKEDGRAFLRMNWSPNSSWSVIAIAEPINNGTSFWIYEKEFKPKGVVKVERRGKSSLDYIGFDVGLIDDTIPFVGEYFNFELIEGFSMYLDARHSHGYAQYKPDIAPDTLFDMVYVRNTEVWNTLLVTGFRWEGSFDFRIEYIYNSYGLDAFDMQAAFLSALPQHPRGDQNLKRLLGSGMELLGQNYAYVSLRIPDLFIQNNNLSFRYLKSLMDQSASLQTALDTAIGDAWTLFAELNISFGESTQELSALEKGSGLLGLKWNF